MLDCIIVGSGLAGISAALTLRANGRSFALFGDAELSEKIVKAERIHNYPGFIDGTGQAFADQLKRQLNQEKIAINSEKVTGVYALKEKFMITTQSNNTYESKTVILAVGVESVKPIDGETGFVGRGVSYCATCDGFLYKNKTIATVCTSKRLEHEIEYLADIAQKVYLFALYKDVNISRENVTVIKKIPSKIEGQKRVEKIFYTDKNAQNGVEEISVDGVFMLKESSPPSVLVGGLETVGGHVVVDRNMQTNIKGCYAAGDCTGRPYQYAKAVGEGNVAAHSVTEYVRQSGKRTDNA